MTTIINNPPGNNPSEPSDSGTGMGFVLGIIIAVLIVIIAIVFGRSYYLRRSAPSGGSVGGSINVQVPATSAGY